MLMLAIPLIIITIITIPIMVYPTTNLYWEVVERFGINHTPINIMQTILQLKGRG